MNSKVDTDEYGSTEIKQRVKKYYFTDSEGNTQPLTQGYIHELLDRVHCLRDSFYSHCVEHPAEVIVRKELEECFQMMCDIYQKLGREME